MTLRSETREPVFNLPGVVTVLVVAMLAVHVVRLNLSPDADLEILALFAFVPDRLLDPETAKYVYPGGEGARIWCFVSYAFLHADFTHVAVNLPMLAAFGSLVARRVGPWHFLAFCAFTAAVSAATHLVAEWGDPAPVIGASGIVSGMMGAFVRIAVPAEGADRFPVPGAGPPPLASLGRVAAHPRARMFVVLFLLTNLILVFGGGAFLGPDASVAWEAHLGGFFGGLFAFPLFDRPARR